MPTGYYIDGVFGGTPSRIYVLYSISRPVAGSGGTTVQASTSIERLDLKAYGDDPTLVGKMSVVVADYYESAVAARMISEW